MEVVRPGRWRDVGRELLVPYFILEKINAECSSDDEKMSAVINYVVTIIPDITWEKIAAALYNKDEEKAVEQVKPHLHILPGRSCFKPHNTVHSLNTCTFILLPSPTSILKCRQLLFELYMLHTYCTCIFVMYCTCDVLTHFFYTCTCTYPPLLRPHTHHTQCARDDEGSGL